ncbi:hypothetical protein PB2503_03542 [Parvularcula bermudensis HTCC2503]|uniref:Helix-turn-helix domain-containing protein n=1 Tax=Parvularcula bermudensis (strain ATCC BAA-594 / HTCC2503 / KCTC 12087) TaxID=314260 RepID=E0TDM8_PARBH|nr:helix-turn-helix domain-containing protein [Parvularcula bermudensis]ADM08783.1 hypothetical protein PB2503_03542 [Parvularcula bermudensis HTCC2503]
MSMKTSSAADAENDNEGDGKVVQLRPAKASKASERKWGKPVMDLGFCIVPSLLLRAQNRLGLNPTQLAVLMQLCDFWWDDARKPYPSKETLSERLGLSKRQLQRYIADLEQAGLVTRIERHHAGHGGKLSNIYDLSGLVAKLKKLEPEFREADEKARETRKAVRRRAHRRAAGIKKTA